MHFDKQYLTGASISDSSDFASLSRQVGTSSTAPLVVASALGTAGDVNPMIGICAELSKRGYPVRFLANDHFKAAVQSANLPFMSLGPASEYEAAYSGGLWNRKDAKADLYHQMEYHAPARLRSFALFEELREQHPDIVVLAQSQFDGAVMAAERHGIPWIEVCLVLTVDAAMARDTVLFHERHLMERPWGRQRIRLKRYGDFWHFLRYGCGPPLNEMRRALGMRSVSLWHSPPSKPFLSLALLPDWYLAVGGPGKPRATPVGFPFYDAVDPACRESVDRFLAEHPRPLVFTPGTGVRDVRKFLTVALNTSRALGVPCILLTPHWRELEGALPPAALGLDYVDLGYLLPSCSVLVHHGGIGTTAQAIRAGIPQLIRPLHFDQFENGYRVWKLGLGAYMFEESFNTENCTQLLRGMLRKAPKMKTLGAYAERLKDTSGVVEGARAIVDALARRPQASSQGRRSELSVAAKNESLTERRRTARAPFFTVLYFVQGAETERPAIGAATVLKQAFEDFEVLLVGLPLPNAERDIWDMAGPTYRGCMTATEALAQPGALMDRARGRWLVPLNATDEWMPDFLSQHHRRLANAEEAVAAATCVGCEIRRNRAGRAVGFHRIGLSRLWLDPHWLRHPLRAARPVGACFRRDRIAASDVAMEALLRGHTRRALALVQTAGFEIVRGSNIGVLTQYAER